MSEPLVLYLADSIDARAGAELIRERWPGAELVEGRIHPSDRRLVTAGHIWALGYNEEPVDPTPCPTVSDIRPTPDASIAMQVWRRLNHTPSLTEQSLDRPRLRDMQPPTWLRYLDDAVTERWELPDSREVWEWMLSCQKDGQPWQHGRIPEWAPAIGRAILRARERWEEGLHLRIAQAWGKEENDELRERAIAAEGREQRLRAERDELLAGLVEALDLIERLDPIVDDPIVEVWERLRKLAGVDHG